MGQLLCNRPYEMLNSITLKGKNRKQKQQKTPTFYSCDVFSPSFNTLELYIECILELYIELYMCYLPFSLTEKTFYGIKI